MNYISIQKAIKKVGNRFDLVLIAAFRARQIQIFSKDVLSNNVNTDKTTILALQEIENDLVKINLSDIFF